MDCFAMLSSPQFTIVLSQSGRRLGTRAVKLGRSNAC